MLVQHYPQTHEGRASDLSLVCVGHINSSFSRESVCVMMMQDFGVNYTNEIYRGVGGNPGTESDKTVAECWTDWQ